MHWNCPCCFDNALNKLNGRLLYSSSLETCNFIRGFWIWKLVERISNSQNILFYTSYVIWLGHSEDAMTSIFKKRTTGFTFIWQDLSPCRCVIKKLYVKYLWCILIGKPSYLPFTLTKKIFCRKVIKSNSPNNRPLEEKSLFASVGRVSE